MHDRDLIQIADAALADAYRRAGVGSGHAPGQWMACRPGCHACCIGVFPITAQDASRLNEALLAAPATVQRAVRQRASASRERLAPEFPGNPETGELFTEAHHEDAFEDFANDEVCPVLNPATGTCDLYAGRPLPCRTFGPPMPNDEGGLAVCELCFIDAPAAEVARCAVDAGFLLAEQVANAESSPQAPGPQATLIAFAISR